jgi:tRNA G18 (ribose-2'-O)-methylase SpoU
MDHMQSDFNISQILRNSNAFGAKEMYYIGTKQWDKRGAVGTYHYTQIHHYPDTQTFLQHAENKKLTLIAIEQTPTSQNIYTFNYQQQLDGKTPCFIFGNETHGINPELLQAAHHTLQIPQYGSVRSINAAAASAIALSYWTQQHVHTT